jgi:hypothetical protein
VIDNLYLYLQPDFSSIPSGSSTGQFGQLRDAYADISFDQKRVLCQAREIKNPFQF